jgi:hypothetical protein
MAFLPPTNRPETNLFTYAANDAVNRLDFNGRQPISKACSDCIERFSKRQTECKENCTKDPVNICSGGSDKEIKRQNCLNRCDRWAQAEYDDCRKGPCANEKPPLPAPGE